MYKIIFISVFVLLAGCATLTNDAFVPMSLVFSDGSEGTCQIRNKRFSLDAVPIPSAPLVRRSDDLLIVNCKTEDGREAFASIPSKLGGKIIARANSLYLEITDAITDKLREYPAQFVISVEKNKN